MAVTDAAKAASVAVRELAESFRRIGGGSAPQSKALTDALRRKQNPELVEALKEALGLR